MSARPKVVIVGGGVAGLTAAHELIERDFDVDLYERRLHCGGKAASVRVDVPPKLEAVPGEHGFRFFPGWYRHLPHTLGRIPIDRRKQPREHLTVLDHLVNVPSNLLVSYNRDPVPIVLHAPRSTDQAHKLLQFVLDVQKMGLTIEDAVLFFTKLVEFLSVPDDVRRQQYDRIAWTDFVDAKNRTPAFRLLASNTRSLVAAKPEEASAYTIATMAVRTLLESSLTLDRVLDGPTSEVWIEPWVEHLKRQGVRFHLGYDLDAIAFDGTGPGIASLRFSPNDDRWIKSCRAGEMPPHEYKEWCRLHAPNDEPLASSPRASWESNFQRYAAKAISDVKADYYLFAVPIEQMAYYVNRSTMMTHYSPSFRRLVRLSGSVDWMAGIQFYLRYPLNLEAGHIVFADSEWALTAIEQTQLWRDAGIPREVQSILSVDVSQWNKKGRFNKKEAFRCSKSEIAEEVWKEVQASFNRTGGRQPLQDSMLVTGELEGSFYIDDNVAERYDRKKQAAYDRSQALRLGADELLSEGTLMDSVPLVFGERIEMNIEPLLVNRPGSLALRPDVHSDEIPNMFLAADYVNTATNLACMEGANEAARMAVNAILDQGASKRDRCQTWEFSDSTVLSTLATVTQILTTPAVLKSIQAATSAATTLRSMATERVQDIIHLWKKR